MNGIPEGSSPGAGKAGGHGERAKNCLRLHQAPSTARPNDMACHLWQ